MNWRIRVMQEFEAPTIETVRGLIAHGYSVYAAAGILEISPHTLKAYCLAHRIQFTRYQKSPDRKQYTLSKPHTRLRLIEHAGQSMSLGAWAKLLGIGRSTISNRLDVLGWSVADALGMAVRTWGKV
jgi:hypothetical protein